MLSAKLPDHPVAPSLPVALVPRPQALYSVLLALQTLSHGPGFGLD